MSHDRVERLWKPVSADRNGTPIVVRRSNSESQTAEVVSGGHASGSCVRGRGVRRRCRMRYGPRRVACVRQRHPGGRPRHVGPVLFLGPSERRRPPPRQTSGEFRPRSDREWAAAIRKERLSGPLPVWSCLFTSVQRYRSGTLARRDRFCAPVVPQSPDLSLIHI